jgi:hypothetical protein
MSNLVDSFFELVAGGISLRRNLPIKPANILTLLKGDGIGRKKVQAINSYNFLELIVVGMEADLFPDWP